MKLKSVQCVYYLDTISIEEEFKIIDQTSEQKQKIIKNKAFGKCLQLSETKLLNLIYADFHDYFYTVNNQNCVFLTLMLLSSHPFINFLNNFKNKISDTTSFPLFENFVNLLVNKQIRNIDSYIGFEDCEDIFNGYSAFLKFLHNELVNNMHFEEDTWSNQKKSKSSKSIYPEHSPIVELFQIKIQDDAIPNNSGTFEIIKDLNLLNSSLCKKKPYIILLEGESNVAPDDYIPSALITLNNTLVIFQNEKTFEYKVTGFNVLENQNILKYKNNVKCVLYSRI